MRLGLRLTCGFGFVLLAMGALAALILEADRRQAEHRAALDTVVQIRVKTEELGAVSGSWLPGGMPSAEALEQDAKQIATALGKLQGENLRQDEALRFRNAQTAIEKFHRGVLDVAAAHAAVQRANAELDDSATALTTVLDGLWGKTRDAAYLHPDGYVSSEHVTARLTEWRDVVSARMQLNEAVVGTFTWQRAMLTGLGERPDPVKLEEIRTILGALVVDLTAIESRISDEQGKADMQLAVSETQRYLDAISGLEEAANGLSSARFRLRTSPEAMQEPLTAIEERNRAAIEKVRGLASLGGIGLLAFAVLVALMTTVGSTARLRRGVGGGVRVLLSLAEGKVALPSASAEKADVGGIVAAATQVALAESDISEKLHAVADGHAHIDTSLRSAEDALGRAVQRLADDVSFTSRWIEDVANGVMRPPSRAHTDGNEGVLVRMLVQLHTRMVAHSRELQAGVQALFQKVKSVDAACGKVTAALDEGSQTNTHLLLETADMLDGALQELDNLLEDARGKKAEAGKGDAGASAPSLNTAQFETLLEAVENGVRELAATVSLWEDVARQADTLAINVSIEAARAGESGRGMHAVAEELRAVMTRCREQGTLVADIGHRTGKQLGKMERTLQSGVSVSATCEDTATTPGGATAIATAKNGSSGVATATRPSRSANLLRRAEDRLAEQHAVLSDSTPAHKALKEGAAALRGAAVRMDNLHERVQGGSIGLLGVTQHLEALKECAGAVGKVATWLTPPPPATSVSAPSAGTGEGKEKKAATATGKSRGSGGLGNLEPLTFDSEKTT